MNRQMAGTSLLFADDFSSRSEGDDLTDLFVLDGDAGRQVRIVHGAMELRSGTSGYEAANLWLKQPLPQNIRVEFSFQALTPSTNMVFLFPARLEGGLDLLEEAPRRNGHYAFLTNAPGWWQHQPEELDGLRIPPMYAYTFSLFEPMEWRIPIRKNPGWILLGRKDRLPEKPSQFPAVGENHHYVAECRNGRIRIIRDEELLLDVQDTGGQEIQAATRHPNGEIEEQAVTLPIYQHSGHFGIRTHRVHARFEYLRIYALEE